MPKTRCNRYCKWHMSIINYSEVLNMSGRFGNNQTETGEVRGRGMRRVGVLNTCREPGVGRGRAGGLGRNFAMRDAENCTATKEQLQAQKEMFQNRIEMLDKRLETL